MLPRSSYYRISPRLGYSKGIFIGCQQTIPYTGPINLDTTEDTRQHVADVVAVIVLTRLNMLEAEPDFTRFASLVASACAAESPETLQKYASMDWQKAMREIKIAFGKHYLASHPAGPDGALPPEIDEQIGKCLLSAFFKFITFRSINPGWYATHLDKMQLPGAFAPGA